MREGEDNGDVLYAKLREYQRDAINGLRQGFREGHKSQVLVAPTGAGKTLISSYLMKKAAEKKTHVSFIVDRVALVDQTSAVLDQYGIDHGVIQADHWRFKPWELIQVCSAQTLESRGIIPETQMVVVDEAHCIRKATADLIKSRPDLLVFGLTASPLAKGMKEIYSNVVNVTTTNRLIETKFLVPLKMYAAKAVDMAGAKVVAGEWSDREIAERGREIIGDIVSEWVDKTLKHFGGPAKTIVFAATVDHGEELCRQFNAAGYNFQQISYRDTNDDRRREIISEFRKSNSTIDGLVSCEVLTKGFDVPDVKVGISARPYKKSLSSHIQQLGRVMRPAPDKEFALWLDHSGNCMRFKADVEDIFANGFSELDDGAREAKDRKEPTEKEKELIKCAGCGYILAASMRVCPSCGKERVRRSLVETVAGVMVAVDHKGKPLPDAFQDKGAVWRQLIGYSLERKRNDLVAAEKFALAQYKNIYGTFPAARWSADRGITPSLPVVSRVRANLIRWGYSKRAKGAMAT